MKICCIANPNSPHTIRLIKSLEKNDQSTFLIGTHPPKQSLPSYVNYIRFPDYIYLRKISFPLRVYLTRKTIRSLKPDIVHALGGAASSWLARYAHFHPYVVTIMGSDINLIEQKSRYYKRMTMDGLRTANTIICVSKDLENKIKLLDISNTNVFVLPFGVDTQIYKPANNQKKLRDKLGIPHNSVVISIRAMQHIYNPLDIARSIPAVLSKCPDTLFLIFVYNIDDRLLNDFKLEVERGNTSKNVRYIEQVDDEHLLSEIYQIADAAISIPQSDGTPMSVLECMACGIPVIVSDLPSLRDWVIEYENGMIIQPGDISALSYSISYLLMNKLDTQSMGINASRTIHQHANLNDWVDQMMSIYNSTLAG